MANNTSNGNSLLPLNGGGNGNGDQRRISNLTHPQLVSGNFQELGAAGATQGGMNSSRMGQVVMAYPNGLGQSFSGEHFCPVVNNFGTVEFHINQPILPFGRGPVAHNTGPTAGNLQNVGPETGM